MSFTTFTVKSIFEKKNSKIFFKYERKYKFILIIT